MTPYNEKQSSYDAEATAAIASKPDGLYLIATPVDGATIARAWISQGGPAKFLLNDGMNSPDFIASVGAKYLNDAYGTSSGTNPTASTEYFNANYKAFSGIDPSNPAADRAYDAGAIVGLGDRRGAEPGSARHPRRDLQGHRQGRRSHSCGQSRLRQGARPHQAVANRSAMKASSGRSPSTSTATSPGRSGLWKITDGKVTTVGEMSTDDVNALKAKIAKP